MSKLIEWVEIPASDIERAVSFYNKVLNLQIKAMDFGKEKMAFFPNGEGAISEAPNFSASKDGVLVTFNAPEDVDSALENVSLNGGKIVQPKTKIEAKNRDSFALFLDSEGNRVGIYED